MTYLYLAVKFWRECIIVLLAFLLLATLAIQNHTSGKLNAAEKACELKVKNKIEKTVKPYIDAQKQAETKAQKASEDYEQAKESERVKTEKITRTVQKIVDRPIYINTCFDPDGVSAVNAAGNTSEP